MKKIVILLFFLAMPAISLAGQFNLKPGFLQNTSYNPTLLLPCWNGVFDNFAVQYQAYYQGAAGSIAVAPTAQSKHGLSMLLTWDKSVMNHANFGALQYIKIEYKDKPGCTKSSGFSTFTKPR